jgi:hypothetical protein
MLAAVFFERLSHARYIGFTLQRNLRTELFEKKAY